MSSAMRLVLIVGLAFVSAIAVAVDVASPSSLVLVSAASDTGPSKFDAPSTLPSPATLSCFRTIVANSEAFVERGDLTAARTSIKSLDVAWDGSSATPISQAVARWRIIDRAIDRGLDRALLALAPSHSQASMSEKALVDLLAAIDQVSTTFPRRVGESCP